MAGNATELTSESFDAFTATGIVLVDFWAPWCGPCKMMGPVLDKVAAAAAGKATVATVDIDEHPTLARRFGVRSLPTLVLLKDGDMVKQWVGVQGVATLSEAIAKL